MSEPTRLSWDTWLLLMGALLLLSVGQILFKYAAATLSLKDPRSLLSPSLLAALAIYGVATIMWILVLKKMPLSLAFPFYGLTFLLVPLLAHYLLGEKISCQVFIGGAIIMIGVLAASWGRVG